MSQVRKSRPPPAVELQRWSLADPRQLRSLRKALHQAFEGVRPSGLADLEGIADHLALVATELATNALQHGFPPTVVRLLRHDDRLLLDVADHAPGLAPHAVAASFTDDRGRGLPIARALSLDVGWYTDDGVKHVWASFPIESLPATVLVSHA